MFILIKLFTLVLSDDNWLICTTHLSVRLFNTFFSEPHLDVLFYKSLHNIFCIFACSSLWFIWCSIHLSVRLFNTIKILVIPFFIKPIIRARCKKKMRSKYTCLSVCSAHLKVNCMLGLFLSSIYLMSVWFFMTPIIRTRCKIICVLNTSVCPSVEQI